MRRLCRGLAFWLTVGLVGLGASAGGVAIGLHVAESGSSLSDVCAGVAVGVLVFLVGWFVGAPFIYLIGQ